MHAHSTQDSIVITRKAAKILRGGHPWAFRGEILRMDHPPAPGVVVRALDEKGYLVGQGYFNDKSLISFRLITRQEEEIGREFWLARLTRAHALRKQVVPVVDTVARLVHGEADGIPGLVVDRYGSLLVVQTLIAGIERTLDLWISLLAEVFEPTSILARNDQKTRDLEGLPQEKRILLGQPPLEVEVMENGCRFIVDPWNGQKTGAFLDQRENRLAARGYGRGRVLDAFSYQGWFGIECAAGADSVTALDGSAPALEMVRRNADLNGVPDLKTLHGNVFDQLYRAAREGEQFDLILLDPPAFAKSHQTIDSGVRGYKEINLRAMRLLPEGGILITSSCSFHLSEEHFLAVIQEAARDGGRQVQILEKRTQARDHPMLLTHPESYYLKCFVLRIL